MAFDLDNEELRATRKLHGVEPEICHCETDLNKVSEIMKEREEKAFKYDCLMKKIKDKLDDIDRALDEQYEESIAYMQLQCARNQIKELLGE